VQPASPPTGGESERGLSKRARVAILVVVLGGLLVVGMIVSARRRDDYDHKKVRVQLEAQAAGATIDVDAFRAAWAKELTGEWAGDEQRPARGMIPDVPGAEVVNYTVPAQPNPADVIVDYQFSAGGQDGCVRVVVSAEGANATSADDVCVTAFPT